MSIFNEGVIVHFHCLISGIRMEDEEETKKEEERTNVPSKNRHPGDDFLLEGCNQEKIREFSRNVRFSETRFCCNIFTLC